MDEKNKRGSMREDQDRERQKKRQETPGRSPQSPGSRSSGRGSHPNEDSNRPGGGSSSGMPDSEGQKGSRDYFHEEEESER